MASRIKLPLKRTKIVRRLGVRPLSPTQHQIVKTEPKNITALAKGLKNLERVRAGLIEREVKRMVQQPSSKKTRETAKRIRAIEKKANYLINQRRIQLEGRAFRDLHFTDLLNRTVFRQLATNRMQKNGGGSLVLLDIDHFKKFNDEFGHGIGDVVIGSYARALREESNKRNGFAGRYGGEEMLVWLPIKSQTQVVELMGTITRYATLRAQEQVAKLNVSAEERKVLEEKFIKQFPTFSAGVVPFVPGQEYDKQITLADKLLYHAKNAGRKRIGLVRDGKIVSRSSQANS